MSKITCFYDFGIGNYVTTALTIPITSQHISGHLFFQHPLNMISPVIHFCTCSISSYNKLSNHLATFVLHLVDYGYPKHTFDSPSSLSASQKRIHYFIALQSYIGRCTHRRLRNAQHYPTTYATPACVLPEMKIKTQGTRETMLRKKVIKRPKVPKENHNARLTRMAIKQSNALFTTTRHYGFGSLPAFPLFGASAVSSQHSLPELHACCPHSDRLLARSCFSCLSLCVYASLRKKAGKV